MRLADKNQDGKLSAQEFGEGLKPRERPAAADGDETDGRRAERMFKRLDANGDGKVTLDEVPEERREGFKRLIARGDKDGDGGLNEKELAAALSNPQAPPEKSTKPAEPARPQGRLDPKQLFSRLDQNSDGKVTLDEVPEEAQERIERLIEFGDKDGDGVLSEQEFVAAMARARAAMDGSQGTQQSGAAGRTKQFFSRLDKNGDGKVTLDEVPEERREGFKRLIARGDKNGDKALSLEEFSAVFAQGPAGAERMKKKAPKNP